MEDNTTFWKINKSWCDWIVSGLFAKQIYGRNVHRVLPAMCDFVFVLQMYFEVLRRDCAQEIHNYFIAHFISIKENFLHIRTVTASNLGLSHTII